MIRTDRFASTAGGEDRALEVGVMALQHLASDPVLLDRFLGLSGLDPHDLRAAAANPAFFAGLLDFMLAHEATLEGFCRDAGLAPEAVNRARQALARRFGVGEA